MSRDKSIASLVASDLVTGYGKRIVTRTSFTIPAGSVAAVVGPNGVGKTTLLKTLVGLLAPLNGTVTLGGIDTSTYRRRFGIGYLPETIALADAWSGRGLIALTALAAGRVANAAVENALEIAGVDFDLSLPIKTLSKGMRQRLALAMVLIPPPSLLLLDEPEAGLDPAQRVRLRHRLREFAQGGAIVVVASHDVSGICTIADEAFLMTEGRMASVNAAELLDPQRVVQLFQEGAN